MYRCVPTTKPHRLALFLVFLPAQLARKTGRWHNLCIHHRPGVVLQTQSYNFIFIGILALANLTTALIAMLIMAQKGRSGLVGFAMGFSLSVFGIVIAMVLTEDPVHLHKRMMKFIPANPPPSAAPVPVCPNCRSALAPGAGFCARCGTRVR